MSPQKLEVGSPAAPERDIADVAPLLGDSACQVWWARTADARPALDRILEPAERDRRRRLARKDDQDRLTVAAALARLVLARQLDQQPTQLRFDRTCRFCGARHGKPTLIGESGRLQFSVSHSGARVVVAVVRGGLVGVDIERLAPGLEIDALVPHLLSDQELIPFAHVAPQDQARGLLTYWTRKEALLKATGDGMRAQMNAITVSSPDTPALLRQWSGRLESLPRVTMQTLYPGPDYVGALAVLGLPTVQVQEFDGHGLLGSMLR